MTRKKIIQSFAIALLMFSGVSIKAERIITNEQRWWLVRMGNYFFWGTAAYVVTQVATTYLSEKIGYKIPKNVTNALASLAHFCAQTTANELIVNPSYPESSIMGKEQRFLGNIASTVGVFAAIHFKLFGIRDEVMGIALTGVICGIVGEKVCSYMNVLEKNYEKKNNSIEQLQKIIEEKKVSN